jgi:predicted nucleotidyltransferase
VVDIPAWIDELCRPLVERLCSIDGVEALVLGGSQARGTAWPDSDVDIALGYYPGAPFSIEELDRAASELDDQHRTGLVTNFGEWDRE